MTNFNYLLRSFLHIVSFFLLLATGLISAPANHLSCEPSFALNQEAIRDYFISGKKEVQIEIRTNQIGVLVAKEVTQKAVLPEMRIQELSFEAEYPGGIMIFNLPQAKSREELGAFAQRLVATKSKMIRAVGLVAWPAGGEAPMLLTDELVVQFKKEVEAGLIKEMIEQMKLEVIRKNPFVENQFLLRDTGVFGLGALETSRVLAKMDSAVAFAHPNFIPVVIERETVPNDPLFGDQWHHRNTGQGGGTVDADIDTPEAWDFTTGNANILIAVIDSGFDSTHPDLVPNLWTNPGEIAGNNIDDENNGCVDDIHGYDFYTNSGNIGITSHGTSVAGCVGARGDNNLGVTGTCPVCSLMLICRGSTSNDHALAFDYARSMGAEVITNSWGYAIGTPVTTVVENAIVNAATTGRGGLGCVVFFAMNNPSVNDCTGANPDISSIPEVIGISRATNQDSFNSGGFGNCMDLLGPTHGGTRWIVTTDIQGANGYNNSSGSATCPSTEPSPPPTNARDYTYCFNGTSAATPIVAGIAGLVLDLNPNLTRLQVQRLLQDTADKVEDSLGAYSPANGFSSPATGHATHGYGRANAFEAVRIAAPVAAGGKGGVDIFMRDNRLDWGNTQQPSSYLFEPTRGFVEFWWSVDIKVDAPPFGAPPTTHAAFEAFSHEDPIEGQVNRVFVRVRNRGPNTANAVKIKLHWAFAGTSLPALPSDFWTQFPNDSTDTSKWHPIGTNTINSLPYCGASIAGTAGDAAKIVQFDFQAPTIDFTKPSPRHYCLLAIIDSPDDPLSSQTKTKFNIGSVTKWENNATHRNVTMASASRTGRTEHSLFVRNPYPVMIETAVRAVAPKHCKVLIDEINMNERFRMGPGEEKLVTVRAVLGLNEPAEITLIQERFDGQEKEIMGGYTIVVTPGKDVFPPPIPSPWTLSLHTGVAIPRGHFTDFLDKGLNIIVDIGYELSPRLSVVGLFGYNRFKNKLDGGFHWLNLSGNLRYYFRKVLNTNYYVGAGPGFYIPESGDNKLGFNLGAGVDIGLTKRVMLESGIDYHKILDSKMEFVHLHLGLVIRFP